MSFLDRLLSLLIRLGGFVELSCPEVTVTFVRTGDTMPNGIATVTLSAPDPRLNIVKRPIVVTVGSKSPMNLDGIAGPVTFPANEGDTGTVTAQDVTAGGVASPLTSASFTLLDNTTVPVAPTVTVSFVMGAPTPTPTPAPTPAPTPTPTAS